MKMLNFSVEHYGISNKRKHLFKFISCKSISLDIIKALKVSKTA